MVPELVDTEKGGLAATFAALGHPVRLAILKRLLEGAASVEELAQPFELTRRAISKHVAVLEDAGLVIRTREAQRRPSRISAAPLRRIDGWLDEYRHLWMRRFDRLDERLRQPRAKEGDDHGE